MIKFLLFLKVNFTEIGENFKNDIYEECINYALWTPFLLIIGVVLRLYSIQKNQLFYISLGFSIIIFSVIRVIKHRNWITDIIHILSFVIGIIALGGCAMGIRLLYVGNNKINHEVKGYIIGKVDEIEKIGNIYRVSLTNITILNYIHEENQNRISSKLNKEFSNIGYNITTLPKETVFRIRIYKKYADEITKNTNEILNSYIYLKAQLYPPKKSQKHYPFDFEIFAKFKKIGGVGFGYSKIYKIKKDRCIMDSYTNIQLSREPPTTNKELLNIYQNQKIHTIMNHIHWEKIRKDNLNYNNTNNRDSIYDYITTAYDKILLLAKKTRLNLSRKISGNMRNKDVSDLICGLLLGESYIIHKDIYEAFRISGTSHIIAISGMHLAIMSFLIFKFVRFIILLVPCSAKYTLIDKISYIISSLIIILYLLLVNFPISGCRAVIIFVMGSILCISNHMRDSKNLLAFSCSFLLLIRPECILEASMQMSFITCLGLVYVFNYIKSDGLMGQINGYLVIDKNNTKSNERMNFDIENISIGILRTVLSNIYKVTSKSIKYIIDLSISSLVASIFTLPLIMFHFHSISPYSIFTNLVSVPIADFIVMPLSMILLVALPLGYHEFILHCLEQPCIWLISIAKYCSKLKMASINVDIMGYDFLLLFLFSSTTLLLSKTKSIKYISLIITLTICLNKYI